MPLLLLLVFGIIEYGLMFKNSSSISAASASGARTAATQPRQNGYQNNALAAVRGALSASNATPQEVIIYKVALNASNQPINWSNAQISACTTCWRFTYSGGTWTQDSSRSWPASAQRACGSLDRTDYVGVWIKARHDMVTGMFGSARTLTEKTVMRLEPMPAPCS